ncbi:MAG TPA: DUF3365 domain-containing protein [Nitrospiraceae bacterium]|jgi:hypothetical protein|nr:DUF3365 domain-containing protein [Nitrospiraceae bacterium]
MIEKTAGRILGGLCAIMLAGVAVDIARAGETAGIPPEVVAEYIHAVIQADRTIYSTHVVDRLQDLKFPVAVEEWRTRGTLPLPAQMLQMAGQEIQGLGLGLRIRLASLGPIYKKNGPADQFERAGLEAVAKNPRKPYTGMITEGDKHFFKAIFADRAVSITCVACHNSHELSTKRDYKLYDVMGGIIISFPVQ